MNPIVEIVLREFNKFTENQKDRAFGVPELLYALEFHVVMHIGDNPGMHMAKRIIIEVFMPLGIHGE